MTVLDQTVKRPAHWIRPSNPRLPTKKVVKLIKLLTNNYKTVESKNVIKQIRSRHKNMVRHGTLQLL